MNAIKTRKKGSGRPRVLTDEERKQHKTNYMLNTDWFCDVCNGRNYRLAGKSSHLKTKIHKQNLLIYNLKNKINDITKNS